MKKIKPNKYLYFIFFIVCFIALLKPLNIFAAKNEGNTKVIARIEAPSEESSESSQTDNIPGKNTDQNSPQTGDDINLSLLISLMLISGGTFTVTALYSKKKNK